MKRITKAEREVVRNKLGGRCAYCGELLGKSFHVDHFNPVKRQPPTAGRWEILEDGSRHFIPGQERDCIHPNRDTLDNKMPACSSCNLMKSDQTIEQFRFTIQNFINSLNIRFTQYRFAKKYGLLVETGNKVKFYYENFIKKDDGNI